MRKLLLLALLAACSRATPPATGYAAELARVDTGVRALEVHAAKNGSWLTLGELSGAYQDRARLTGNWDDYAKADAAVQRAFALAPAGAGPFVARASLSYGLHRFDRVEADLQAAEHAVLVSQAERRRIAALRADVALEVGRYGDAGAAYAELARVKPDVSNLAREARFAWSTGALDEADARYAAALAATDTAEVRTRAYLSLQRGLVALSRSRLDDALARYREADAIFPGWWLVREHVAEVQARRGETAAAVKAYRALVDETGDPEFMDALAALTEEPERSQLVARAGSVYAERMARFPEAAWGHALHHVLAHGAASEAVELARKNRDLRPGGEARLLLARAYVRAGKLPEALAEVRGALATPYRSAELLAEAARLEATGGDPGAAERLHREAHALDPTL